MNYGWFELTRNFIILLSIEIDCCWFETEFLLCSLIQIQLYQSCTLVSFTATIVYLYL